MKIFYILAVLLSIVSGINHFVDPSDPVLGDIYNYSKKVTPILCLIAVICIYFLPAILAFDKKIQNKFTLFGLNIGIGWTVIGWFVLLGQVLDKSAYNTYEPAVVKNMTEEEIIEDVYKHLSVIEKRKIKNTKFDEIGVKLHDSIGVGIRYNYGLWERHRFNFNTEDQHPNKVTMKVLEEVWRRVHNANI